MQEKIVKKREKKWKLTVKTPYHLYKFPIRISRIHLLLKSKFHFSLLLLLRSEWYTKQIQNSNSHKYSTSKDFSSGKCWPNSWLSFHLGCVFNSFGPQELCLPSFLSVLFQSLYLFNTIGTSPVHWKNSSRYISQLLFIEICASKICLLEQTLCTCMVTLKFFRWKPNKQTVTTKQ